ncbi:alpha/beta hydrolase [Limosilactobacillus pontis]|uniref:alpha/beta hydrolase n=1 Tax=Limosilactobacillus pontis TaxID=35787 RepID=UPI003F4ECEFA
MLKLRSTFPTNTRVLNIYGDKEDGSHSDGDVPVNSAKSYREVEIKGANAQHSTLHNNSQVNRELINFLWRK